MIATRTTAHQPTFAGRRGWNPRRWGLIALVAVIVGAASAGGAFWFRMHAALPDDLDLATTRATAQGLYRVTIVPRAEPIPINTLHAWTLHIETPDGRPVEGAAVAVDGGMPQHGHGLPTRPQVTGYLGNGDYLVEGLKFQMDGWWTVDFDIVASDQRDDVRFNLILK